MAEKEEKRILPQSDLDFYLMTTDPVWGTKEVSPEVREKLNTYFIKLDEDGEKTGTPGAGYYDKTSLWGLLGAYTRDLRLANLDGKELEYCKYHLNLANDLLNSDMIKSFLCAMSRVATQVELSQSKRGFFRKRMHTFTQESKQEQIEPGKKPLMGGQKRRDY